MTDKMSESSLAQQMKDNVLTATEDTNEILKFVPATVDLQQLASKTDIHDMEHAYQLQTSQLQSMVQKESHTIQRVVLDAVNELHQNNLVQKEEGFPIDPGDKRHSAENLPGKNPAFSGRGHILKRISSRLNNGISTICQITALTGLGGIGKSQTALEFAHIHRELYNFIRWIDSDEISLHNSMREFARDFNIQVDDQAVEKVTRLIYERLRQIPKWLLIFDNVEDHAAIKPFLPLASSLQIDQHALITTQDQRWENEPIFLNVFDETEAMQFLRKWFDYAADDELYSLAQAVGNLPIALNHACAYIKQTPCVTISDYLQFLQSDFIDLINEHLVGAERTVMRTFLATIKKIHENDPYAVQILYQCAMVSPDNIPVNFFYAGNKLKALKSLRVLNSFSMITSEDQRGVITVHRLLQKVLLHSLVFNQDNIKHAILDIHADVLQNLISGIKRVCPGEIQSVDNAHTLRLLIPHLSALFKKLNKCKYDIFKQLADNNFSLWQENIETVLHLYFDALREIQDPEAITVGKTLLEMLERSGTKNDQVYANILTKVAQLQYHKERKYGDARKYLQQAIDIFESINGEGHISTAEPLRRLGTVRLYLGDRGGAIELYIKAKMIYEKNNETSTDSYADALNCIGNIHKGNCENAEAYELFQKSLTIKEKLYGVNSIKSIYPLQNMGKVLKNMGKYDESLKCHKAALEVRKQVFGNKHPSYSKSLVDIGNVLKDQKNYEEAMLYHKVALDIRMNKLGDDHLDCASSMNRLGTILHELGRYEEAELYCKRASAIREKALGKDQSGYVYP